MQILRSYFLRLRVKGIGVDICISKMRNFTRSKDRDIEMAIIPFERLSQILQHEKNN